MDLVSSLKRFVLVLILLVVVTLSMVFFFDRLIAPQETFPVVLRQTIRTVLVIVFGSIIILFIQRSKPALARHVGVHASMIFQFFMILVVIIAMTFGILSIFQVPPTELLVGGGIVSIVMGLVISTFVGNLLAGALVFMTHRFNVGDNVLVNNVPGKVVEITSMVTRIRNDVGGYMVIPNQAIAQGGVIITKVLEHERISASRLPYVVGDRVYTTYMSGEGTVKELTSFYTKILLDSGRELTFLNTSVLNGSVAVAKISADQDDILKFSLKITWDPEKTMEAIKVKANSNPDIFKSVPTVLFSSLDGKTVELEVSCKVAAAKKSEAKSLLIESASLPKEGTHHSSAPRNRL